MTSCRQIVPSLSFFPFIVNLEQSGSPILDAYSVKLIFLLKVTVYVSKAGSRSKASLHSSHTIALSKDTGFAKEGVFLPKKMLASAKLRDSCY